MMLTRRNLLSGWKPLAWGIAFIPGLAASAGSLSLENSVLPGGGGSGRTGRFSLDGSIGQPVAESAASIGSSSAVAERAGFWSQVVRWINADPVARQDIVERRTGQGTHVLIRTLLANDSGTDLELLGLASFDLTTAAGGSVFRDGPWLNYQPPASGADPAEDSFTYTARDALGNDLHRPLRHRIGGITGPHLRLITLRPLTQHRTRALPTRQHRTRTLAPGLPPEPFHIGSPVVASRRLSA